MTDDAGLGFLDSEELFHERARKAVGFDDFGNEGYREGLRVLLAAYDEEARLSDYGRTAARAQITSLLEERLRAEKRWAEQPDVLEHEIRRPIVILGLVRTGSTALHYLMGQDPDLQCLQYWLASSPQPRPPREQWDAHPRFRAARAEIEAMYEADPSLKAVHFMMADGPEECRHLLMQSFTDDSFEANATVPSYVEWLQQTDMTETYRRHQKLVKLVGSTDTERRWLLKYPVHVRNLAALLTVYPDACIVWTHRDPRVVLPSYVSLIAGFRALHEDPIDRDAIGQAELELWASSLEQGIEVRKRHDPAQFYDLYFDDFMRDPIAAIDAIYARFGQELSQDGRRALEAWHRDNPQHKHGRHEYTATDIGVDRDQILERCAGYMQHFGIEPE